MPISKELQDRVDEVNELESGLEPITAEDIILGDIEQADDIVKTLRYEKVDGIMLLKYKNYKSTSLNKEIEIIVEFDETKPVIAPQPIRDSEGEIVRYEDKIVAINIKSRTKNIISEG